MTETLIISDIHLGSSSSKVKYLTPRLKARLELNTVNRIILLGDIFQDINFKRLTKYHWEFLSLIRKYSDIIEIIWVAGNHDYQIIDVMSHLVGIKVYEKYEWIVEDKKYCAIHGHQFDPDLNKFIKLKNMFIELYLKVITFPAVQPLLNKCISYIENKFTQSNNIIRNGAINFAKENNYDFIFCGHTHIQEKSLIDKITYINTGSWVNDSGVIVIADPTEINLFEFKINPDS